MNLTPSRYSFSGSALTPRPRARELLVSFHYHSSTVRSFALETSLWRPARRATKLCSRRLCHDEIFERVEVGERGRAVRHTGPVTLLARTHLRAPFSSPEGRPHQQAPNRDSKGSNTSQISISGEKIEEAERSASQR